MFFKAVGQKTALIPLSVYTFSTLFFWMFGTHVIFAEIGIMQIIIFLCKKVFVHMKGSFEYIKKLVYTFEVLIRLGN